MKPALSALLCLPVAFCATTQPLAPVSCVPADYPKAPTYADTADALKGAPDFGTRYQLLAGEWFARNDRLQSDEAIIDNCR